jgi:hypothetical protein
MNRNPTRRLPGAGLFLGLSLVAAGLLASTAAPAARAFSLSTSISNPGSFTPVQLQILQTALAAAEALWESQITGYQPGITLTNLPITVVGQTTGFASAQVLSSTNQGGFRLATSGRVNVNINILEPFSNFQGTGLNVIDELMAHEIAHVLGFGPLWVPNGVYVTGSGRYTGAYGLAAYRAEFDPLAEFVPVELAGSPGTPNFHWDQLMRSSSQEGNPADPWSLDPRVGIVDTFGRDLGLELMTGALDPDFGAPFLSRTTVQSLRDIGFTVVPEPATCGLGAVLFLATLLRRPTSNRAVGHRRARLSGGRIPVPAGKVPVWRLEPRFWTA